MEMEQPRGIPFLTQCHDCSRYKDSRCDDIEQRGGSQYCRRVAFVGDAVLTQAGAVNALRLLLTGKSSFVAVDKAKV